MKSGWVVGNPGQLRGAVQVESSWEGGDRQEDMESKHTDAWGDGETVTEMPRTRTQNMPETVYRGRLSMSEPIVVVGRLKGQGMLRRRPDCGLSHHVEQFSLVMGQFS